MMSRRLPLQQSRDDGNSARGRSPPPFAWEDDKLQQNQAPSPTMAPTTPDSENENASQIPELIAIVSTPEISPLGLSMPPETPESQEDTTVTDSEDDTSEEEYTDDDEQDDNEVLQFIVTGPEPIKQMVTLMAR